MAQKVILIADPGIDTAFAIALALFDSKLDVLAIAPTAGNVSAPQATVNVHTIVAQLDPPRWPRVGAALPTRYDIDGTRLHGSDGLGNSQFPQVSLHGPAMSDRLIVELVNKHPGEVTLICLGPLTVLQSALNRDPTLTEKVHRAICLGGAWRVDGNATTTAEFHFACDPEAAHDVLHSRMPITLVPLDVMRKIVFSPSDLLNLPEPDGRIAQFLSQIVPFGIRASSNLHGIEGFHMKDALGIIAKAIPQALTTRTAHVDIETRGELTRGMSVIDVRPRSDRKANVELAIDVDVSAAREYIFGILGGAGMPEDD